MILNLKRISLFTLLMAVISFSAHAQSISYDRYADTYREIPKDRAFTQSAASNLLVAPLELVRWPLDKSLLYVEKHRLDEKAIWIYDQIKNQGITPHFNIVNVTDIDVGAEFDFVRITRQKLRFPDLIVDGWIHFEQDTIFDVGSKLGWNRIAGTDAYTYGIVEYENRPQEHFYGLGPHSSRGDGSVFNMEQTTLKSAVGYDWTPSIKTEGFFSYRNINISGGKDGGRGQIREHPSFSAERIPGIGGDSILTMGFDLAHDTRNSQDNTIRGGLRRFSLSFNEGLDSSDARYFKYVTEFRQYIRLGSDRRVLAIRFYGEHNDKLDEREVPFHQMAKLGGYGTEPRLSETHRAFDFNRFFDDSAALFNLEYRYTIWEYRNFKVDSVLFWDEGQVFDEFSKFKISDFRESYGMGFRLSLRNSVLLSFEVAHGDEGTNLYVKSKSPF